MYKHVLFFVFYLFSSSLFAQSAQSILTHDKEIGFYQVDKHTTFIKDNDILSPKSADWISDNVLAINALEKGDTVLYDTSGEIWKKMPSIIHKFSQPNFEQIPHYPYPIFNKPFMGKPVEMISNQDKAWIPYYRFDWDSGSKEGSAIAQIDLKTYQIEKLIPAGNIPKMIRLSHNGRFLANIHWGDNTIGIYEMKNNQIINYHYIVIDRKLNTKMVSGDRDSHCGFCLRGAVFTADDKYLLVGRMGGGGIAVIDMSDFSYKGTIYGVPLTPRHLVLSQDGKSLYISTCASGQVARINIEILLTKFNKTTLKDWTILNMGSAVRTIALSHDEKYLYATLNSNSQLAVIDVDQFKILDKYKVASFPVGLAVSPDDKFVIVTSQGKSGKGGGNHVDVFRRN